MIKFFKKYWDSPTLNTWMSYSTKALSLFVVLPLILNRFNASEVALWYLFFAVISLQGLADLGLRFTFIRLIAYAIGGAKDITNYGTSQIDRIEGINWTLVEQVYSIMKHIYKWITLVVFVAFTIFGTWSLIKPISELNTQTQAWVAWAIIVSVSCIKFYGTIYSNYLEGLNKISLVRRWETITSICASITSILVLLFLKSLLWLVIANQFWSVVNMIRDIMLCRSVENGRFKQLNLNIPFDKPMFKKIWAPAWRSGLSSLMSNGLTNISSIVYAQFANSVNVAGYLLALRVISQIRDISAAPFYSKLPLFAQLRAQNKIQELAQKAQKGMLLSNLIFILGAVLFGLCSGYIIEISKGKLEFVSSNLWLIITIAYFIHRYGAMHIQLYSTSNHIISHIADGVSGMIFIIVSVLCAKSINVYAIPVGMIAGYLGFYAWYSGMHSYKLMKTTFFKFEKKASGPAFFLLLIYIAIYFFN